jgi:hypothetical protein
MMRIFGRDSAFKSAVLQGLQRARTITVDDGLILGGLCLTVVSVSVCIASGAGDDAELMPPLKVRITDSAVLRSGADPATSKLSECQPLKYEDADVLKIRDMPGGAQAVQVRVLEGQCKDTEGWLDASHTALL